MITFTQIQVTPIFDLSFSKEFSEGTSAVYGPDEDWQELLTKHHNRVNAGIGIHRIYGIMAELRVRSDVSPAELTDELVSFFKNTFSEENLLSAKQSYQDGEMLYNFLLYPLVRRALQPDVWFEVDQDSKEFFFERKTVAGLQKTLQEELGDTVVYGELTGFASITAGEAKAQVDLISEMNFAAPEHYDHQEMIYDALKEDAKLRIDMPYPTFRQIITHTVSYFTVGVEKGLYMQAQGGAISRKGFMEEIEKYLKRQYKDITENDLNLILNKMYDAVFGNYILEPLLNADDISDIKVLDPKQL
jgi:hypothetical protein